MIRSLQGWIHQKQLRLLPAGSLGARFARGAFWSLMGTVIAQGLGMVASIIAARLLGASGYGEFGMINSTVGVFGVFAGLGLGLTATKYVAEYRISDPERAGRILGLATWVALISSGTVSVLFFFVSPWLAANTLNAPHLVVELRLGCILLFFNALNGLQTGALSGFEAFRVVTKVNFLRGLMNFPVMIAGVWWYGLTGLVAASVLVSIAGWWLNRRALQQECKNSKVPYKSNGYGRELPVLWHFALPAMLSGIVVGPFTWLANTLLVNHPGGYSELGLVSAANQWRNVLMLLPSVFGSVLLPMLSSTQDDEARFNETMETSQSLAMMIVIPVATVLLLMNNWIMALYGEDFATGGTIFVSLVSGIAIAGIGSASGSAVQATGRMWLAAGMNLTWGLTLLIFAALFVPYWGGLALALGFALAYLTLTIWGYVYLLYRSLITKIMVSKVFGGVGFIVLVAVYTQVSTMSILGGMLILVISLVFSVWIWPTPSIRRLLLRSISL